MGKEVHQRSKESITNDQKIFTEVCRGYMEGQLTETNALCLNGNGNTLKPI